MSQATTPAWRASVCNKDSRKQLQLRRSDILGDLTGETFPLSPSNHLWNIFMFWMFCIQTKMSWLGLLESFCQREQMKTGKTTPIVNNALWPKCSRADRYKPSDSCAMRAPAADEDEDSFEDDYDIEREQLRVKPCIIMMTILCGHQGKNSGAPNVTDC